MTEPHLSLGYTILVCDDLVAMRSFYANDLGLPVLEERADYVKLDAGPVFIALRRANRTYDHPDRLAWDGRTQLAFPVSVDEVDGWHQRLSAAGTPILDAPTDQDWGHRTVFVADPEGNLIEFYAPI